MQESDNVTQDERRSRERVPLADEVSVCFQHDAIVGPGQNISDEGVFFVTDGAIRVTVHIAGRGELHGEVVRVQSMGEGKLGMAIKFL